MFEMGKLEINDFCISWYKGMQILIITCPFCAGSISCVWRARKLFNHVWMEKITNNNNGSTVALNVTSLVPKEYSLVGDVSTVEEIDGAGPRQISIVTYTLFIISATLAHGGRFQCSNDNLDPTETGCLDIFITRMWRHLVGVRGE